jgi:Tfp pilus assembly protein FimV
MQVSSFFRTRSPATLLSFMVGVMPCMTMEAHAADPVLGAAAAPTAPTAATADVGKTYVVKAGDTLDKVVRNTMADSPLRADLLKEEIVKLNPQAFTKGSKSSLLAGATLRLPRHEELLQKHLKPALDASGNTPREASTNDRRQWVRYP